MLGILCGLQSEARIARRLPNAIVACAAARPGKARDLARELVARGATRLMSFGIAGALDPALRLGDLMIGAAVIDASTTRLDCDAAWAAQLAGTTSAPVRPVYGSEVLIDSAVRKGALFLTTGCAIVDMESQCLAEVATERRLPLAVVRAVCDTAAMDLPPFLMAAIDENGGMRITTALAHLARNPRQLPDLLHVMQGTGSALRRLKKFVAAQPHI